MTAELEKIIDQIHPYTVMATEPAHKIVKVGIMRDIMDAYQSEEITFSKVCEIINCLHIIKRDEHTAAVVKKVVEHHELVTKVKSMGFTLVSEALPETKDYRNGSCYSETVWATDGKEIYVMRYAYVTDDDNNRLFAWCNCYNNLEGDGEYDDNYIILGWKPINKPVI